MNVSFFSLRRGTGAFASLALALCGVQSLADTTPKLSDAFPLFESYIKVSGQAPSVTGNPAAYARRFQQPENGSYGIEALHLSKDLNKDTSLVIDGRALSGAEDYLAEFKLTKSETGTVDVGFKRFRTFYDGIGGFFPTNKAWMPLANEELHTDRAKFWTDITIARPNEPVFHFRYSNELRSGQKDSTIWGDSDLTGIPIWTVGTLNPISSNRKLVAAYIDLNERQQNLEASIKHTVGNTELEFSAVRNWTDSVDTRYVNRYPGELKPFPAIPTQPASLVPATLANNATFGFDQQSSKAKVWTYTGKFETKVSDMVTAYGGVSYQDANADIGGNRQMTLVIRTNPAGTIVNAVGGFVGASGRPPYSYTTDFGRTAENVLTGNVGLMLKPQSDFFIKVALKGEDLNMNGTNLVTYISNSINQTTGAVVPVLVKAPNTSSRDEKSWTPELDVRYTGIKNVSLYGNVDYRFAPGTELGSSTGVSTGGIAGAPVTSSDNTGEHHEHYKLGVNWNLSPIVTLRAETFYKDHVNKYTGFDSSNGGQYVLGYQFHGLKLSAIVKPLPVLSFTTRYVRQTGKMDTRVDYGTTYQSMDSENHMIGETVDWTPNSQVYLQGNVNVVFATTSTAYPRAGGAANDVLHNADNNYVNGSVVAGFVVDKATDAQLQYSWYRTNNYQPAVLASLPYGSSVNEYTVTVGVKRKLSDRLFGNAKVGYFDSKSDTTGGNTNFRGPMAFVSLEYSL